MDFSVSLAIHFIDRTSNSAGFQFVLSASLGQTSMHFNRTGRTFLLTGVAPDTFFSVRQHRKPSKSTPAVSDF
jgi:hypothetical protein